MKVKVKTTTKFSPVVIRLETKKEFMKLWLKLNQIGDKKYYSNEDLEGFTIDEIEDFCGKIWDKLDDVKEDL